MGRLNGTEVIVGFGGETGDVTSSFQLDASVLAARMVKSKASEGGSEALNVGGFSAKTPISVVFFNLDA